MVELRLNCENEFISKFQLFFLICEKKSKLLWNHSIIENKEPSIKTSAQNREKLTPLVKM